MSFEKNCKATLTGQRHFARVADQAEAGDIGHAVHGDIRDCQSIRGLLVQRGHRLQRRRRSRLGRLRPS